jgi:hypothetical protein
VQVGACSEDGGVAVGIGAQQTGVVVATTNGGANWVVTTVPLAMLDLHGVSVASPRYVQAVGSGLAESVIIGERPAGTTSAQ